MPKLKLFRTINASDANRRTALLLNLKINDVQIHRQNSIRHIKNTVKQNKQTNKKKRIKENKGS